MHLHVIQHVPFEGPAAIAEWAEERGHTLKCSLALTEEYPSVDDVDFLVVMGGPMDADDDVASPWLPAERRFIAECIAAGRLVLGVCLGAQIIAEVLGGKVQRCAYREVGWYAVNRTAGGAESPLFSAWPEAVVVGQWHSDTFEMPLALDPVWSSDGCRNQAFVFDGRVVGLQFHLEWTAEALEKLMQACAGDLRGGGLYEMTRTQIEDEMDERLPVCRALLFSLLDGMETVGPRRAGTGSR